MTLYRILNNNSSIFANKLYHNSGSLMQLSTIERRMTSTALPRLIYGTAWKSERTKELVVAAIKTGFRGVDTACQPKHYNEIGVGEAIEETIKSGLLSRQDIYLQTKFTSFDGQDPHTCPYNPTDSLENQVITSLKISLKNLKTEYLDCLVLHSPMGTINQTMQVWNIFETFVDQGIVKRIGISNCYHLNTLKELFELARIKPTVLQNRFYKRTNYDQEIRHYCREKQIYYQSFWTLTANPHILSSPHVLQLSTSQNKSPAQLFFAALMHQNIIPLSGTTNPIHMKEDVEAQDIQLDHSELQVFNSLIK